MRTMTFWTLGVVSILSFSCKSVLTYEHDESPLKRFGGSPLSHTNDQRYLRGEYELKAPIDEELGFERRRRIPYYFPAFHSKSFWKRILPSLQEELDEESKKKKRKRDEVEFEYLNQQRHRLPGYAMEGLEDETDMDNLVGGIENNDKKRGIMYYYPNYRYAFFADDKNELDNGKFDKDDDRKKRKREDGGILERIRNDDPSDMGYD